MADGLRTVARAYYEKVSEEERDEVKDIFTKLDLDGDEKISLEEFITGIKSVGEGHFKLFDFDKDGFLDFSDFLALVYHSREAIYFVLCDSCNQILMGPYFTCVMCLDHFPRTYDLCCDCYCQNKFKHHHQLSSMLHNQAALSKLIKTKSQPAKEEIEQLREIAELYYEAASPDVRLSAKIFFNSMDSDGDEKVDDGEFLSFMLQQGYDQLLNRQLFNELDVDRRGALGFMEVMTVYYVIKSGRPNCDLCKAFIPGIFFACVQCFRIGSSYNLCRNCYKLAPARNNHIHPGGTQFLDNYTLLHAMRGSSKAYHHQQDQPSSSMAIVPASTKPRYSKRELAFKALDLTTAVINMVGNIAMASSKCTIM